MSINESVILCGVHVPNLSCMAIDDAIAAALHDDVSHQIVTLNPEILYRAAHDEHFRDVLNQADLRIIDGFGVVCAYAWHRKRVLCRMTGVELMWQLLDRADRNGHTVFLATNAFGLTLWEEMSDVIRKRYPDIRITGANMDPHAAHVDPHTSADIVVCNFGVPQQEFLIHTLVRRGACRIGIGVGGAFDFATGKIARAPRWMRSIGCEWLWRLLHQPRRWRRIVRATILFPLYVIRGR